MPKKFGTCEKHQDKAKDLYCVKCLNSICTYCKSLNGGSHYQGEFASHNLMPINFAYE